MSELVNLQTSAQVYRDAVVFLAGSDAGDVCDAHAVCDEVDLVLAKVRARRLLEVVEYCDISKPGAIEAISPNASLFIFLIDGDHLSSAHAAEAAYLATRKAVTGNALIVPLLLEAELAFDQSPLAFLTPVCAYGDHLGTAIKSLEGQISQFVARTGNMCEAPMMPLIERLASTSQIAETVDPLPCHMSAYDDFIEQLISRLQVMRMHDSRRNLNQFAEAVRQVLDAQMVYCYYRSKNGELHLYEAESNQPVHDCSASVIHGVLEDALKGYANDTNKCSLHLQNFLPQLVPDSGSNVECMVVVNHALPNCGVFVATRSGFSRFPMTEILSTVINSLHDSLAWAKFETFEKLKARVYDELKNKYRFVSGDMYEDRRRIFRSQLSNLNIHFEPMFRFDRHAHDVDVFAYEALAREHNNASAAPVEIFNTASLWGMGFQSELDSTLLETSLTSYQAQIEAAGIGVNAIRPLALNVYPATLRSNSYRELLYSLLSEASPLCGRHLIMEVSEKTLVSPELQMEARKQLEDYRDVVMQLMQLTGVRFAIDDFGVGNSSLSRLDSLKPHYVKIDRDILSFDTQMSSTLIRYLVDSQNQQGASVILEGVDIHSKLSLDELVKDIGVGIIQGHSLSKAVSGFDADWERSTCQRVKRDLGWSMAETAPGDALLH